MNKTILTFFFDRKFNFFDALTITLVGGMAVITWWLIFAIFPLMFVSVYFENKLEKMYG